MLKTIDKIFAVSIALSLTLSVSLWFMGMTADALFTGLWVPSLISLWAVHRTFTQESDKKQTSSHEHMKVVNM